MHNVRRDVSATFCSYLLLINTCVGLIALFMSVANDLTSAANMMPSVRTLNNAPCRSGSSLVTTRLNIIWNNIKWWPFVTLGGDSVPMESVEDVTNGFLTFRGQTGHSFVLEVAKCWSGLYHLLFSWEPNPCPDDDHYHKILPCPITRHSFILGPRTYFSTFLRE